MTPKIDYYCPCLAESPHPPPPHLASSTYSFHPLHNLFFCEECDAVRCNRCVLIEVSGYYCPNCLFEVPSASVRAEKNRCARNCFLCPNCRNTLTVVPSDPPENVDSRMSPIVSTTLGEPPFFLYCNHCRWDSAEVGITFEKPTGLAAQLQKFEDSAPESLEFEHLKEHFEPFLRASSSSALPSASSHHVHTNPITAAASSALARDVPGAAHRQEYPDYKSRVEVGNAAALSGEGDVEFLRHLETVSEVAALEQRSTNSWISTLRANDLKPLRIPLQSKKSKRCPSCRHILIKPEQKAQSVRFKIKLVAANYLPAIAVTLPHAQAALEMMKRSTTKSASAAAAAEEQQAAGALIAGHSYSFHLAFTNPLYDPIQIRLAKAVAPAQVGESDAEAAERARRNTFQIQLPSTAFPVGAFAEAWEYDDEDEEMFLDDDGMEILESRGKKSKDGRGKTRSVGIVEKRANVTIVSGEVLIPKEARGDVKFNMLVSYTYRSDDPEPADEAVTGTPSRSHGTSKGPDMKNFSFYTVVELGPILYREEPRLSAEL
ncbi:dynactin p62 [Daedaleopsis nitida]|nr:dynactin p62 [Daedaleopsis nitida]